MWRIQTHAQFGGTWLSDFVVAKCAPSVSAYGENSVRSLAPPLPTRPALLGSRGGPGSNKLGGVLADQPSPAKPSMQLLGPLGNGVAGRRPPRLQAWGTAVWDKGNSRPQKGRFRQQAEYIVWGSNGDMPVNRPVPCLPGVFKYGKPFPST